MADGKWPMVNGQMADSPMADGLMAMADVQNGAGLNGGGRWKPTGRRETQRQA